MSDKQWPWVNVLWGIYIPFFLTTASWYISLWPTRSSMLVQLNVGKVSFSAKWVVSSNTWSKETGTQWHYRSELTFCYSAGGSIHKKSGHVGDVSITSYSLLIGAQTLMALFGLDYTFDKCLRLKILCYPSTYVQIMLQKP